MALQLQCDQCGKRLKLGDHLAGKRVKCPSCQQVLTVPTAADAAPPKEAAKPRRRKPATAPADVTESDRIPLPPGEKVLFKCRYGRMPKLMLFGGLPFLTIMSIALLVAALKFDMGLSIRGLSIPPWAVAGVLVPGIMILVVGGVALELRQRKHPQRVVVTSQGIIVPKGRFVTGEFLMTWKGMTAAVTHVWFCSDVALKNGKGQTTRLNSMLFPASNDFDKFLETVSKRASFS